MNSYPYGPVNAEVAALASRLNDEPMERTFRTWRVDEPPAYLTKMLMVRTIVRTADWRFAVLNPGA